MSYLAYIDNSGYLLAALIIPALIITYYTYRSIHKKEESLVVLQTTVIVFAFFLLLTEACGMFINRITSVRCHTSIAKIKSFQPHFVSEYGRFRSEMGPNRYSISLQYDDNRIEEYVLKSNRFTLDPTGKTFRFKVCKSIFGLPMINSLIEGDREIHLH
jgi:hypothetical protein